MTLEFKGSLDLDVGKYVHTGEIKHDPELLRQGVLKEIVAFLNTDGGELLIGVLEPRVLVGAQDAASDIPSEEGNVLFGLALEYGQGGWDAFQRRLQRAITEKIGGDVLERRLVGIRRVLYKGREFCLISVQAAEREHFLERDAFYVRQGNETIRKAAADIQLYWKDRRRRRETS